MVVSNGTIDISDSISNYQGIPLLAKTMPHHGRSVLKYVELLNIIKGYSVSSSLSDKIIVESDLLSTSSSLCRVEPNISLLLVL